MNTFQKLPKLKTGDQVAVISPSAGLPGLFPWILDLGYKRMREVFGLEPKEYPTTRQMGSSLKDRAHDVMAAFADSDNKAVFTSIGGEDQIQIIKYLDPQTFLDNPKPFFGFSDNTHLHNYLWSLGIPSYYGCAVMTEFAFNQSMHDMTVKYLKQALFTEGEIELDVSYEFNDIGLNWTDKSNLNLARQFEKNDGLIWDGDQNAKGTLWGGCVESLIAQVSAQKYLPAVEDLEGTILFIETAEDIPDDWVVKYLLIGFGERGWFDKFNAVLVGRPKAWEFNKQLDAEQKAAYKESQRKTVIETIRQYNETIPIIQNLDFGHTAPQIVLPMGNKARIDGKSKKIFLTY